LICDYFLLLAARVVLCSKLGQAWNINLRNLKSLLSFSLSSLISLRNDFFDRGKKVGRQGYPYRKWRIRMGEWEEWREKEGREGFERFERFERFEKFEKFVTLC